MKLLLDQNISYKILPSVSVFFPESTHVRIEHLEGKTDGEIWEYAKARGFTIVTQDADFYEIALLKSFPPNILWLRCGNTSTQNIERLLVENYRAINESTLKSLKGEFCIWFFYKIQMIFCQNELFRFDSLMISFRIKNLLVLSYISDWQRRLLIAQIAD